MAVDAINFNRRVSIRRQHFFFVLVCLAFSLSVITAKGQTTMDDMQYLTINENIATVVTASEPVRFVDISTARVVGDQPISTPSVSSRRKAWRLIATVIYWQL